MSAIQVFLRDSLILESAIIEQKARTLALLAWAIPHHISNYPEHSSILWRRFHTEVSESLVENPELHDIWEYLCNSYSQSDLRIDIFGLFGELVIDNEMRIGLGGDGGHGAWPGGGGGGGGGGTIQSGSGGNGADGAVVIFSWSDDGQIVYVDTFVTPGMSTWNIPVGVDQLQIIAFGGGGGGGSGAVEWITKM